MGIYVDDSPTAASPVPYVADAHVLPPADVFDAPPADAVVDVAAGSKLH